MLNSREQIGKLDERVTFQRPVNTSDEYNQPVSDWQDVATVWARVEDSSGGESFQADQVTAYMNTVFAIRYRDDVTEKMRILRLRNGRYYNIRSIKNPDRKRTLQVTGEMLDDPFDEPSLGEFSESEFSNDFAT